MEPVDVTAVVKGGLGLARGPRGAILVRGALPGERVVPVLEGRHGGAELARVGRLVSASPDRREAPCPHGRAGCGGCGWQHVEPATQLDLKRAMVADALRRQGGRPDLEVRVGPGLADTAFRTTLEANGWRHLSSTMASGKGTTQVYDKSGNSLQIIIYEGFYYTWVELSTTKVIAGALASPTAPMPTAAPLPATPVPPVRQ